MVFLKQNESCKDTFCLLPADSEKDEVPDRDCIRFYAVIEMNVYRSRAGGSARGICL